MLCVLFLRVRLFSSHEGVTSWLQRFLSWMTPAVERVLVKGLLCKNPEYQVQLATNGLEAIAAYTPDLVVTDLVMPEMDGLELVRTMRRRYPRVPVILMTAFGDESTAVGALEAGAASYIPFVVAIRPGPMASVVSDECCHWT